jgi:hypothetical protein
MKPLATAAAAFVVTLAATSLAAAQSATEVWRTGGFATPESVSYDPGTNALYVSNINSPDMSANGQGYISQLGLDGKVLKEKFAEGLNAPKGTFVRDGILYVAGVEEVVEIDLASGAVRTRHAVPGATFVNDVAVADDGTIYATETMQNAIYTIKGGTVAQLVTDPGLAGANGIIIDGNRLLVATLGDLSGGFENLKPSNVKAVDIATKTVTDYGSAEPVGTLDGIEALAGAVLVTDNGAGRLIRVAGDGTVAPIGDTGPGSADFEYVEGESLAVIPLLNSSEVAAFKLSF